MKFMASNQQNLNNQNGKLNRLMTTLLAVESHMANTNQFDTLNSLRKTSQDLSKSIETINETGQGLTSEDMITINVLWKIIRTNYPNLTYDAQRTEQAIC